MDNRLVSATVAGGTPWAVGIWQSTGPVQTLIEVEATGPCATATPTATVPAPTATATAPPPTDTPAPSATPPAATATATAPAASPTPGASTATPPPATATPPPASSATAVPPTATAAAPTATGTPAATETPCPLSFSDVHATDYFYQPVLYLACNGVISGYADGTFRPYNNTTRAQMVKIVVLGFGLPITTPAAGGNTFADVPTTFPFFDVIETAAAGQIVSGYACGGPGEPCDGANRPYFRPYADVTRGQLAKIVVLTAGWAVQNPVDAPFADVRRAAPSTAWSRPRPATASSRATPAAGRASPATRSSGPTSGSTTTRPAARSPRLSICP